MEIIKIEQQNIQEVASNNWSENDQLFYKFGLRVRNFQITTVANNTVNQNIALPGAGRAFMGLAIIGGNADFLFSLTINNDIVIGQASTLVFAPNSSNNGYVSIIRPLTGQDSINIALQNLGGTLATVDFNVFYRGQ